MTDESPTVSLSIGYIIKITDTHARYGQKEDEDPTPHRKRQTQRHGNVFIGFMPVYVRSNEIKTEISYRSAVVQIFLSIYREFLQHF